MKHLIRGNWEVAPEGQLPLPAETVTIAEVTKTAGYATATFGKLGMGFFDSTGGPQKQGVDHFFGYKQESGYDLSSLPGISSIVRSPVFSVISVASFPTDLPSAPALGILRWQEL